MKSSRIAFAAVLMVFSLSAQQKSGGIDVLTGGVVDLSKGLTTKPMKSGTTLPGSCGSGEFFLDTDAVAPNIVHYCQGSTFRPLHNIVGGDAGISVNYAVYPYEITLNYSVLATLADLQTDATKKTTSAVGTDSYAGNLSPAITAYSVGTIYGILADVANNAAASVALNGLAVLTLKTPAGADLATGTIFAGNWVYFTPLAGGTTAQLLSPAPPSTGTGALCDPFDLALVCEVEEWFSGIAGGAAAGSIGKLGWLRSFQTTAPTMAFVTETGHPGILECTTSAATANETCQIYTDATFFNVSTATNWEVEHIIKTPASLTGVTQINVGVGYGTESQNLVTATYLPATNANWNIYTCNAGFSCTTTSSGVAVAAGTWYRLKIFSTVSGTIRMTVNGANEVTSTTNLPTANMGPILYMKTNVTAAAIRSDRVSIKFSGLSR